MSVNEVLCPLPIVYLSQFHMYRGPDVDVNLRLKVMSTSYFNEKYFTCIV